MTLDYKLHKKTLEKAEEILSDKREIQRREQNLIDKIEKLQKANNMLMAEQEEWNKQKSAETVRLKAKEKSAQGIDKQTQQVLDEALEGKRELAKTKKLLDKELKATRKKNDLLRRNLTQLKKKKDKLAIKEATIDKMYKAAEKSKKLAKAYEVEKGKEYTKAKTTRAKADEMFQRAKEKNTEANSLKIRLGIKEKGLNEKEREVARRTRENKFRRQEIDVIARELQVKRQLLTKAYTQADVEDLDIKVEQIIRTEDSKLLPKNRR